MSYFPDVKSASEVLTLFGELNVWTLQDLDEVSDNKINKSKLPIQMEARKMLLDFKLGNGTLNNYVFAVDVEVGPTMLSKSNFGVVTNGIYKDTKVALKQIDCNNEDLADVWKEVVIHQSFGANHDNILRFIGYSISKDHKFFIFTKSMENGSLLNLLQTTDPQYNVRQKFLMTIQIVNGMKFLESIHIIHRDLAVQNVLISFQNGSLKLKIVDFGLSKQDNYKLRANSKISLEWTVPEVINHRKYPHKSDVWSFEVTFWEILRDGQHSPLNFMSTNSLQITWRHLERK